MYLSFHVVIVNLGSIKTVVNVIVMKSSEYSSAVQVTFIIRLVKTGSFMPSGMLVILSIVAVVVSVKQFMGK